MKTIKDLKLVYKNTFMLYILQISTFVFPLLTFPYITRVLGPEKYGVIIFSNAAMMYFQMLVDFGFLLSATKECSYNRENKNKLIEIVSSVIQAKIVLAVIGFMLILVLIFNVDSFSDKKVFIILSYLSIFLSIFLPDYFFRGLEKMSTITYRTLIAKVISTIMIFILIKKPGDYVLLPVINSLGNIIIILLTWYILIKKFQIKYKMMSISNTFHVMKQSSVFFLSRIASTAYGASNTFVLGFVHSNIALAQFGAATTLNSSLKSLFSPIADSLYPYMVSKRNYKLIKKVLYVSAPIIVIGTFVLFINADYLILLLCGDQYVEAVPIFKALLPIILLTLPIYLLGFPVLGAMNMNKEANMSVVYASVLHIIGLSTLLLIGQLNFIAVAILTCVSEAFILGFRIIYVIRGRRVKKINESLS